MKQSIRDMLFAIISVLFVLALITGVAFQTGRAQNPQQLDTGETARTVTVSGTGRVEVQPDTAVVRLGVQTQAETASEALNENSQQIQAVIDALQDAGVASEDIQTQTVQLFPRYETPQEPDGTQTLAGFTAINIVEVETGDLDNLGELLDAAVQAGANTIENIGFDVSNRAELLDQALTDAVEDARNRAQLLASAVNAELGPVLTIDQTGRGAIPFGFGGGGVAAEAAVPIEPGTQSLSVDVQVTWMLVDTGEAAPGTQPAATSTP